MIVADVNLVAYLLIEGDFTQAAREVLQKDDHWIAPAIWRDEFINVLATNVRENEFSVDEAMEKLAAATHLIRTTNVAIDHRAVIELAVSSRLATYDCVFVWLARHLSLKVVTRDKKILERCKDVATSIENFAEGK